MKLTAVLALALAAAPVNAQIMANASRRLRASAAAVKNKEWGRRQSDVEMEGERFLMTEMEMSVPDVEMIVEPTTTTATTTTTTETEAEWQTYKLCNTCTINYRVNAADATVSFELIHEGEAWVSIAFSETGAMVGSEAVIGTPDGGQVLKYNMVGRWGGGVTPMADEHQTLTDASVEIVGGQTIMRFTKILEEDDEIKIVPGQENTLLLAHGYTDSFPSYHPYRRAFNLPL
eukprot:CAMPEP_0183725978 /NCGR_PEP_ID=MMETSP0737-20130205/22030_1 /TAXON_ID=385413 /ORGANISM="Thalassiosira miniscula, Strain CCMP1093" /LENGTH=231 /DNA_ID=CAMNT_0025957163 /DNA_START=12 /DNA_END=710 /DNA_ORIENTATION=-